MNHKFSSFIPVAVSTVWLVACGQQKPAEEGAAPAAATVESPMPQDMPMGEQAESQAHNAMGNVTAVDAAAGTVTIAHEAVASAGWPAMTMTFKLADPKQAAELHANDHVKFTFKLSEKGEATVTTIAPAKADGM